MPQHTLNNKITSLENESNLQLYIHIHGLSRKSKLYRRGRADTEKKSAKGDDNKELRADSHSRHLSITSKISKKYTRNFTDTYNSVTRYE